MGDTMGDRIRAGRVRLRLTQAQLAHRIGITPQALGAIENGTTDPRVSRLAALADVLGVSADYLLGKTDDPRPRGPVAATVA